MNFWRLLGYTLVMKSVTLVRVVINCPNSRDIIYGRQISHFGGSPWFESIKKKTSGFVHISQIWCSWCFWCSYCCQRWRSPYRGSGWEWRCDVITGWPGRPKQRRPTPRRDPHRRKCLKYFNLKKIDRNRSNVNLNWFFHRLNVFRPIRFSFLCLNFVHFCQSCWFVFVFF